jgi:hypothetical protein
MSIGTFVGNPVVVDLVEVAEVKGRSQVGWTFVEEGSVAVKFVVEPLSFVGFEIGLVVEGALAVHFVLPPLALVLAPVLVVEGALAVPLSIQLVPHILASHLEKLLHKLQFFRPRRVLRLRVVLIADHLLLLRALFRNYHFAFSTRSGGLGGSGRNVHWLRHRRIFTESSVEGQDGFAARLQDGGLAMGREHDRCAVLKRESRRLKSAPICRGNYFEVYLSSLWGGHFEGAGLSVGCVVGAPGLGRADKGDGN